MRDKIACYLKNRKLERQMNYLLYTAFIILCGIANRWRGGGFIDKEIPHRKLTAGIAIGVAFGLVTQNAFIGIIALAGLYIRNIMGTGKMFNAIHGRYASKLKGIGYGSLRGLLTLIPAAAYGIITKDYTDALFGLLGTFQGCIYYLGGIPKEHRYSVAVAEFIDGMLYGVVLLLCWRA